VTRAVTRPKYFDQTICVMKRKIKRYWSTIPMISNRTA